MARAGGPIVGLDLGRRTGFAVGYPNTVPRSCSIDLNRGKGGRTTALGNLIAFLDAEFRHEKPRLVAKEAPLSLGAFKEMNMGEAVVRMTYALQGAVEGMCARFGIPWCEEADSTIRKHFVGVGRLGTRELTKRAVVNRCRQLGYFARDVYDEDRADALAVWDWACAHKARVAPEVLHMFGGAAPA